MNNLINNDNKGHEIYWLVPNGIKEDLPNIQIKTIVITLLGFALLAKAIWDKSR